MFISLGNEFIAVTSSHSLKTIEMYYTTKFLKAETSISLSEMSVIESCESSNSILEKRSLSRDVINNVAARGNRLN